MRLPTYLSPSQFSLWSRDRDSYYMEHLSDARSHQRFQTQPMSVGASFDAYVKAEMFGHLFGVGSNPKFEFEALFETQVEPANRDWARSHGQYLFECYKVSGAYADLLSMLDESKYAPQFEWTIQGEVENVPLLGKPDLRFVHKEGAHVILDWKVSGYCSKYTTSPVKNYKLIRDGWVGEQTKTHNTAHKNFEPLDWKTLTIHKGYLEDAQQEWANQLAIYSWILGEQVGTENVIVCIDQLVAKPTEGLPEIRVANQCTRISSAYQKNLMQGLKDCWNTLQSGHIFEEISKEESDARCELLDMQAAMMQIEDKELQPIQEFLAAQRQVYKF